MPPQVVISTPLSLSLIRDPLTNSHVYRAVIKTDSIHISHIRGGKVVKLGEFAKAVKDSLDGAGLKKWEVELHVYVGVNAAIKAGIEATLRLLSSPN